MIFKDGERKAGFFEANIFKRALANWKEFEEFQKQFTKKCPETFRQELKEYIGLLDPEQDNSKYVGRQLTQVMDEDQMATNQLKNMQEMATAPFGPSAGMTKE